MGQSELHKKKKKLKRWQRIILVTLMIIVALYSGLAITFYFQKDEIQNSMLAKVNEMQDGELLLDKISFSPFTDFPDVSIVLENVKHFERKSDYRDVDTIPIIQFDRIHLAINILDLIKKNFHVSRLSLNDGSINIINKSDSTLNIINALGDALETSEDDNEPSEINFELNLNRIRFNNILLSYSDLVNGANSKIQIDNLKASLHYEEDSIQCELQSNLIAKHISITDRFSLKQKIITINSTLAINDDFQEIIVKPSQLTFGNAHFASSGTIDLTEDGYIDLVIEGDDKDFGILNLFLTQSGVENIEEGYMSFIGSVKGKLFNGIPNIEGNLEVNDLQIRIHNTNKRIEDLNLKASYSSGVKKDLSEARLSITEYTAILPDGRLDCHLDFENMADPIVNLDFYLKAKVDDFEEVFELENINNMSGSVEINSKYNGSIDLSDNTLQNFKGHASFKFDNVAFESVLVGDFKNISGGVVLKDSTFDFNNLNVLYENSEFGLDGSVSNAGSIILAIIKKLNNSGSTIRENENINIRRSLFDITCQIKADASDFGEAFQEVGIDSLKGSIDLTAQLKGDYNWFTSGVENYEGKTNLQLNNLAFKIDSAADVNKIDGGIVLENEILNFNNFTAIYGNNDLILNGNINNLDALITNRESEIAGTLNIKSKMFDFPDCFSFSDAISSAFPFRIRDIDLVVAPKTSTRELNEFVKVPKMEFGIRQLEAEIIGLTPAFTIDSGLFILNDFDSVVTLEFNEFSIDLPTGHLMANVSYNPPIGQHNNLKIDIDVKHLNSIIDLAPFLPDTVTEFANGLLDAQIELDVLFSKNPKGYKRINLIANQLNFTNSTDTIGLSEFKIQAEDFYYKPGDNAMKTLSFNGGLSFKSLETNSFITDELSYSIETIDGVFRIVSNRSPLFNGKGFGLFVLKPFDEVPSYEINYRMNQFDIIHLLESFETEDLINGKMDMDLYLSLSGKSKAEWLRNIDGYLHLYGQHLTIQGIDLDKLIEKFKRTQRFTVADLGFSLALGPAGLLLSKGTSYSRMAIKNSNDSTYIREFLTDYKIQDGVVDLEDVALSTRRNRVAAKGSVDLNTELLNLSIGVINKQGCSIFDQNVGGNFSEPEIGKARVSKVLLAPITNLTKPIKCEPFYEGKVMDPRERKKKSNNE